MVVVCDTQHETEDASGREAQGVIDGLEFQRDCMEVYVMTRVEVSSVWTEIWHCLDAAVAKGGEE